MIAIWTVLLRSLIDEGRAVYGTSVHEVEEYNTFLDLL